MMLRQLQTRHNEHLELIIHTVLIINNMYSRSVYIYIGLSEYENKECKRHCI